MNKEKNNLLIFGFGLAMIVPYLIVIHFIKPFINFPIFVGTVIFLMIIIAKSVSFRALYYSVLLGLYAFIGTRILSGGESINPVINLGLSLLLLAVAMMRTEALRPVYRIWMKVTHFIGTIISGIALSIVFYIGFGIAGIILRIIRKDLLDRTIEPKKNSYWQERQPKPFNQDSYKKHF